jgi:hypothetical protein
MLIDQSGRSAISRQPRAHPHIVCPPPTTIAASAMYSVGYEDQSGPKDLEGRIGGYLVTALRTLSSLNLDISLYLLHHTQNARRDPLCGNGLDEAYTMYEERANECRRLWMKVRAVSERRASITGAADSSPSRSRLDPERPPFRHSNTSQRLMKMSQLELEGTTRLHVDPGRGTRSSCGRQHLQSTYASQTKTQGAPTLASD